MFETVSNVNSFFASRVSTINSSENVKAYIVSILSKYKFSYFDYSNESLTLRYYSAKSTQNFEQLQNFSDWIFFVESVFPQYLQESKTYYHSLAQLSYFDCYKITNRKIDIYLNLADEFSSLIKDTQKIIQNI